MRMYTPTGALVLLLMLLAACGEFPSEPPPGFDPDYHVVVRGRITTEDGAPVDSTQAYVGFATNNANCAGELLDNGYFYPDRSGRYTGTAISPGLLSPRRCVWVIVQTWEGKATSTLLGDTLGGFPATLRRLHGTVPLDTLTVDVVLKRK